MQKYAGRRINEHLKRILIKITRVETNHRKDEDISRKSRKKYPKYNKLMALNVIRREVSDSKTRGKFAWNLTLETGND